MKEVKLPEELERMPCPFCGDVGSRVQLLHYHYQVICNECSSRTAAYPQKEDAIKAWNMRVKPNNGRG